jgi:hypothetical protein
VIFDGRTFIIYGRTPKAKEVGTLGADFQM